MESYGNRRGDEGEGAGSTFFDSTNPKHISMTKSAGFTRVGHT